MAKRTRTPSDSIAVAREVARREVARRWPDLAAIEPTVAPRAQCMPAPVELEQLGAAASAPEPKPESGEYTFTFASHTHTPDGYVMPRIARVTVDSQRRVVKATTSK